MEEIFFNGIWRMDWGLGNPNKTAALIAELMIAVWGLAYLRKRGFWIALGLFIVLGGCLIHTFSRGGLIAAIAGLSSLIVFTPRPWPHIKKTAIFFSVLVIIAFSHYLNAHNRYVQGVTEADPSIINRIQIWKVTPTMMVDAPSGWGIGNSGKAFMQWYQPLDHSEEYRTLVNSHLTWLVEVNWPLRYLYILAWLTVLILCQPSEKYRQLMIPFGIWIVFAVSACFSSVAESLWLWIVPGASFVATLIWRVRHNEWPHPMWGFSLIGVAGMAILGLFILGHGGSVIRGASDQVIVGSGKPQMLLVVDTKVMGSKYGKTLRKYLQTAVAEKTTIELVNSVKLVDNISDNIVILSGPISPHEKDRIKTIFATAKEVILINPMFFPQEIDFSRKNNSKTKIAYGEFSKSRAIPFWEEFTAAYCIEGAGDFIPNWPEVIMSIN